MMNRSSAALIAVAISLAGGCATNKQLYNWGPYESQVYSHFKSESPESQIVILEKHLAEIKTNGTRPPPGFYAHLALLYSKAGRDSEVMGMFDEEKKLYPESSVFINNLINGFKGIRK